MFNQDGSTFGRVQRGLRASVKPTTTLARYQESRIRHFHATLDDYLARRRLMDVRYTAEQRRCATRWRRSSTGSARTRSAQLDDVERAVKLDAAIEATGWRELRTADDRAAPRGRSAVEVAIVAEELARGLADAPFLGPTLAAELRRLAGAPVRRRARDRGAASRPVRAGRARTSTAVAIDAADAESALVLGDARHASCRSPVSSAPTRGRPHPADGAARARPAAIVLGTVAADALDRWTALALAATAADLVGTMQGAIDLSSAYATERQQYGATDRIVPGRAATSSPTPLVHLEGSRTALLHAAWAVDALEPGRRARRRRVGQGLRVPRRTRGPRDRHPGPRRHRQHVGVPGSRLPAPLPAVHRRPAAASAEPGPRARPRRQSEADRGLPGLARGSGVPGAGCARGSWTTTRTSRRRRRPTSTGSDSPTGTDRSTGAGFFGLSWPKEYGGHDMPSVYDVIVDEELAAAGAPPRPSLGYLVHAILHHADDDVKQRFLPGLIDGTDRWCQGFSEPDAGSDLASLRTRARARRRRVRRHRPQGVDELLGPGRLVLPAGPHRP